MLTFFKRQDELQRVEIIDEKQFNVSGYRFVRPPEYVGSCSFTGGGQGGEGRSSQQVCDQVQLMSRRRNQREGRRSDRTRQLTIYNDNKTRHVTVSTEKA